MNRKRQRSASKAQHGAGAAKPPSGSANRTAQELSTAAHHALRAGRNAEAVALCDRALAKQPESAAVLKLRGVALNRLGQSDEGIESIRRAIRLQPGVAEFHHQLAIALTAKGAFEDAIACYREAIRLRPDYARAYCNLGYALKMIGALDDSVAACRAAIAHDASLPEAHNNLAFAFIEQGRSDDAIEACRAALSLRSEYVDAHNNLGIALQAQGRFDQALAVYEESVGLAPTNANAHYNLAYFYEKVNRLADAEAAAAAGLRVAPNHPGINLIAAICERRAGHPKKALDRLSRISLSAADPLIRLAIHFELGQIHDRLGEADAAIDHFQTAKSLQSQTRESRANDKYAWHRDIDALAERFTPTWVDSWTPAAPSDGEISPIFLIGFPRSGTTLLEQILDSHPQLQVVDEQPTVSNLVTAIARLPGGHPDALAALDAQEVERLRAAYFGEVDKHIERRPGISFIDKMPLSTVRAGTIHRIFPNARFILAIRHPCDVCLSCFMQNFMINEAMANFFTLEESAAFYARVMGLWQQYLAVLSLDVHMVRYEDLVENFEPEVRRVLDFVGVDWNDAVLGYAETARARTRIHTPSYSQVTEPIYTRAKYRWHRYRDALAPVMETLAPYIDYFGYADR